MKRIPSALRVGRLVATIAATAFPASAVGQVAAPPSAPVTLIVDVAPDAQVDTERLRDAIARELGVPVVWGRNADGGTLVVRQTGARIIVSFDGPDGRHEGRGIPLVGDSGQAERDIALLAGNVARDQTAQFAAPPVPAATPPAAARVTTPPQALPPSPCDATGRRLAVGVDFIPWIGVSTVDQGRSLRSFSLGVLGALSGGVKGLAVSGLVDIDRGPLCGLQISGVVNVAADSQGAQVSGVANVAGDTRGAQVAGTVNVAGDTRAQVAGTVNVAQRFNGVQIAGVINSTEDTSSGAQIATVNVAGQRLHGVQIGVVNYSRDVDFQLGLVNINASGRVVLDVWTNPEMGLLLAGVKHGGAHYHWIYAMGIRPADAGRPWAALGLGAHVTPAEKVYVDLDVIDELELVFHAASTVTDLYQARVVVGYQLLPELAVFAGPTYNLLASPATVRTGAPGYATDLADTSSTTYREWPGLTLGAEGL